MIDKLKEAIKSNKTGRDKADKDADHVTIHLLVDGQIVERRYTEGNHTYHLVSGSGSKTIFQVLGIDAQEFLARHYKLDKNYLSDAWPYCHATTIRPHVRRELWKELFSKTITQLTAELNKLEKDAPRSGKGISSLAEDLQVLNDHALVDPSGINDIVDKVHRAFKVNMKLIDEVKVHIEKEIRFEFYMIDSYNKPERYEVRRSGDHFSIANEQGNSRNAKPFEFIGVNKRQFCNAYYEAGDGAWPTFNYYATDKKHFVDLWQNLIVQINLKIVSLLSKSPEYEKRYARIKTGVPVHPATPVAKPVTVSHVANAYMDATNIHDMLSPWVNSWCENTQKMFNALLSNKLTQTTLLEKISWHEKFHVYGLERGKTRATAERLSSVLTKGNRYFHITNATSGNCNSALFEMIDENAEKFCNKYYTTDGGAWPEWERDKKPTDEVLVELWTELIGKLNNKIIEALMKDSTYATTFHRVIGGTSGADPALLSETTKADISKYKKAIKANSDLIGRSPLHFSVHKFTIAYFSHKGSYTEIAYDKNANHFSAHDSENGIVFNDLGFKGEEKYVFCEKYYPLYSRTGQWPSWRSDKIPTPQVLKSLWVEILTLCNNSLQQAIEALDPSERIISVTLEEALRRPKTVTIDPETDSPTPKKTVKIELSYEESEKEEVEEEEDSDTCWDPYGDKQIEFTEEDTAVRSLNINPDVGMKFPKMEEVTINF